MADDNLFPSRRSNDNPSPPQKTLDSINIQWFPGHMTKARRMISENLGLIDAVCEITDARIPCSSRNPDLDELCGQKPRLIILNRADQADERVTRLWRERYKALGLHVLETDCVSGRGVNKLSSALRQILSEKLLSREQKGQGGRPLRCMVLGIPNVGKSTFINKLAGRRAAIASDRPGVTRGRQWITVDASLELLDTPGILWPRFDSATVGENLAFTGAIRDEILDREGLAARLMTRLAETYPEALIQRYKLIPEDITPKTQNSEDSESIYSSSLAAGLRLLTSAAKKRGFLISGGQPDLERMAAVLLDEFRGGKLGRISLETPETINN